MEFDWDEAKNAVNRAKHGLSLAEAAGLDWARALEFKDEPQAYGETRIKAFVPVSYRVMVCIYAIREGRFRIISLRKANTREVKVYERPQR
jgi:uncharacterized protein